MFRAAAIFLVFASSLIARDFDPKRDVFAFSNDTVMNYSVTHVGRLHVGEKKAKSDKPTHCCFLFTRSAMQFWKFAHFEPKQPRLPDAEYRARVRAVFRIPTWMGRKERIVFPGYADLWSFSREHEKILRADLGSWLLTYLRIGNWRMMNPVIRLQQRHFAEKLFANVSKGGVREIPTHEPRRARVSRRAAGWRRDALPSVRLKLRGRTEAARLRAAQQSFRL
jgi:hypothetical protein